MAQVTETTGSSALLGAGCVRPSTLCTAANNSFVFFKDVILPGSEQQELLKMPRAFGAKLRYEHLDVEGENRTLTGDVYSVTLRQLWQGEELETGLLVPYDFLNLQSLDAHRVGLFLFERFKYPVSRASMVTVTVNGNYTHAFLEGKPDDVNVFGAGVSLTWALKQERFEVSGAVSYQFHTDDSGTSNHQQHLLKVGGNGGFHLSNALTVNLYGIWNFDATAYTQNVNVDKDYVDLGVEVVWKVYPTIHVVGGYKKVLGLKNFDSDMVVLGALWRF
jgi:hypothetical protein